MSALDQALAVLADRGAEWGPSGLSNHGPMAAEALDELGRSDVITRWVAAYRANLDQPRGRERQRISDDSWRDALGKYERIGDWDAYFARAVTDRGVADVLRLWVPRLAHGLMSSTHGAIRTAHAVRAWTREATELRRQEVAAGLAYWAARCEDLFGDVGVEGFRQSLGGFRAPPDIDAAVDQIVDAAARAYVACDPRAEIAFIHTVTGPSAMRMLLPFVDDDRRRTAVAHAWAAVAAVQSAYGNGAPLRQFEADPTADWGDLADRAVADGDEHTIKMVEACRREHRRSSSPALVAAARRVVGLPIA